MTKKTDSIWAAAEHLLRRGAAVPLQITAPPNIGRETQLAVRWLVETPAGRVGAWDRASLEYLLLAPEAPTAQAAPAHPILAKKHTSSKVDYRGLLGQCQSVLHRHGGSGYAEMLRQLEGHMTELGQRWYAGDPAVVDELLQLYCVEHEAREALAAHPAAPAAQEDALIDFIESAGSVHIYRVRAGFNGPIRWDVEYGYEDAKVSGRTLRDALSGALKAGAASAAKEGDRNG